MKAGADSEADDAYHSLNHCEDQLSRSARPPRAQLPERSAVRALTATGVEPGTADYDGRTPLHLAAAEGQLEVVRYLLAAGAAPQPEDRWGGTPLSDAEGNGHTEIAALLGEHAQLVVPLSQPRQARGGLRFMTHNETPAPVVVAARDHRLHWRNEAACRDVDPELFFPEGDSRSARAQVKRPSGTVVAASFY